MHFLYNRMILLNSLMREGEQQSYNHLQSLISKYLKAMLTTTDYAFVLSKGTISPPKTPSLNACKAKQSQRNPQLDANPTQHILSTDVGETSEVAGGLPRGAQSQRIFLHTGHSKCGRCLRARGSRSRRAAWYSTPIMTHMR
jgi:hypothetical protein